jgi:hypothetical protein
MLPKRYPGEWGTTKMEPVRSVAELCAARSLDSKDLAAKAGLDERRVEAIVAGRWTPSPAERDRIAAAFGLTRDEIAWGHKNPIAHVYGHGPQFGRSP